MSNNITPPKEIWITGNVENYFDLNEVSRFHFSKNKFLNSDIKYLSEQHHNEIVQQYEKKIGELLDRLVKKQDEVIALLKKLND